MRLVVRRACGTAALLALAVLTSAHVGSPNVYFSGRAGPYPVEVVIQPPSVVPGIASVLVRWSDPRVRAVTVRPVFWRAGTRGAPPADECRPVAGTTHTCEGQLWLMATGSYSVDVGVSGPSGSGLAHVPVVAVATGQLALSPFLRALLVILGTLLAAGIITAIHAALGESLVEPGQPVPLERKQRARRAVLIATPLLLFLILGGAHWWRVEAERYRRTMYRQVATRTQLFVRDGERSLRLRVVEPLWAAGGVAPLMAEHGNIAHLFLVATGRSAAFAHLHPAMPDRLTFVTPLPPLPAGAYRIYADVVHETGFQRTLVDSIVLPPPDWARPPRLGVDDAWSTRDAIIVDAAHDAVARETDLVIRWAGPRHVVVNQTDALRFSVADTNGHAAIVEPFLGMRAHAVVVREDGAVFTHIHPGGTTAMATQTALALRDRGDTTEDGRLRLDALIPMDAMASPAALTELTFPYAFPSAGRYRIYVQMRVASRVRTAPFALVVTDR